MPILAKSRVAGPLAILVQMAFCGAATSQTADAAAAGGGQVINEQIQLGDVFATQSLNVQEAAQGLSATTTGVGNIVSATGQNAALDFRSDQTVGGHVEGQTDAAVQGASGYFVTTTSATGNSATAGTCCAKTSASSFQTIEAGGVVAANANSTTGDKAGSASVDVSAIGNTQGWEQVSGEVAAWTEQAHHGLTEATNTAVFCCSAGNVGLSSTAVANNVTVDATNASTDIGVAQTADGSAVNAVVDLTLDSGADVQAITSATANNINIAAQGPEGGLNETQVASAPVNAYSNVVLGTWSGSAEVTANGVGNSAVLSNAGPHITLANDQTTSGDISATGSFHGGAGGDVSVASTAIGNAVSGYACAACGGGIDANNRQSSTSHVRSSSAIVVTGHAGLVSGQSSAVGNSATYQVSGGE